VNTPQIEIQVNGDLRTVSSGSTLTALVALMGLEGRRIAIEHNQEIVPRSQHADTAVHAGDVIEIVQAIGGG